MEHRAGFEQVRPAKQQDATSISFRVDSAHAATVDNLTFLAGLNETVDGVDLNLTGMRVLLKDQDDESQNGLYAVAVGPWKKLGQPDVIVNSGDENSETIWILVDIDTYDKLPTGADDVRSANCASTANQATLSGFAQTIDGIALNTSGMRVLLKDQTTLSQNGLYVVASGAWSKIGQPDVLVHNGALNSKTAWLLTSSNTYEQMNTGSGDVRSASAASTANIGVGSRSGLLSTIDGVALNTAGMRVLLKNQSTASENGLYSVATGAWVKIGQPDVVEILGGTLSGRTRYMLTSANTYQGAIDFWG